MKNISKLINLLLFTSVILYSCIPTPYPALSTLPVTNVTDTSCISGGTIGDEGISPIIKRGVCWSTEPEPTIKNYKTLDGAGAGTFTSNILGLKKGTTYYVRAYATNKDQAGYGNEVIFTTTDK
jgi:hypothetical protein